jgi:membrane protease YdiL (CAAX protease family)
MSTASITAPSPRRRDRLLARPLVRAVLALLAVLLPFALALWLSNFAPKPWPADWPLLLAAGGMVAGYCWYVRKIEGRAATELSLAGAGRELGSGLGLGSLLVLACTLVLLAAGAYSITSSAITGSAAPGVLLKPVPEQVMVAFFEEILFRAVVFRLLEKSWGSWTALTGSTLLFVLAHLPNEHVSALALLATAAAGLALAGAWLLTRRLWLAVGLHFAWNYLFDAVLSVPVSGHTSRGWLQVAASGPEWLSGGRYGIEGSVVTLVAWSLAGLALLAAARRRGHWLRKPSARGSF